MSKIRFFLIVAVALLMACSKQEASVDFDSPVETSGGRVTESSAPASKDGAQVNQQQILQLKGLKNIKVFRASERGQYLVKTNEATEIMKGETQRLVYLDQAGNLIASLELRDNGYRLFDAKNDMKYRLKIDGEKLKLYDVSDNMIQKVKFKEGKFNIYGPDGKRILRGKQKDDGFGIKDQRGRQKLKIKGIKDRTTAAYLSFQIETPYLMLLFFARLSGK
ncbi:MAG: hypothetical protein HRT45_15790 [Bdellovibrionales bacterium]|nr:hypothetical protein [Bdellovibrionales bacterium]